MTWIIEMTNKELCRKTEVERVLDLRLTQREVASKLAVTERQFRRILKCYRQEGNGGLILKMRGKPKLTT